MIKLENVKYAYPGADEYAIKGVSFTIQAGSFVAIVGHNGSGKSTLSKLFNGLVQPTKGVVLVDGWDTKDNDNTYNVRRAVGLVFQNPDNQAVASIIEDDVAFGLENIGMPSQEIRQRVDSALQAVDMYEHRKGTPYRLSGGQKQRIAIAGIIAMQPKVIVFDESTSMLDPKGRKEVLSVAKSLHKQGSTIIWVTHFMSETVEADRIIVMHKGKILLDGDKSILSQVDKLKELSLDSTMPYMLANELGLQPTADMHTVIDNFQQQLSIIPNTTSNSVRTTPKQELATSEDNPINRQIIYNQAISPSTIYGDNTHYDNTKNINNVVISAKNLQYIYSPKSAFRQIAIDDVDIDIAEGDFFGIIGHTGSGKSTFVSHLNGLTKLMKGELTVCGFDLSKKYKYKELRSKVGLVFQYPEYQLFEETVHKDVAFGPKNLGLDEQEIDKRVKSAIQQVGLDYELLHKKSPFELSGGQKRRVALAGVLAMQPKILILDEPTAGLDPLGKTEVLKLIRQINQRGTTIIMISHNMDEIAAYCNKVAVWQKGKIILQGTTAQVFSQSQTLLSIGLDIPQITKVVRQFTDKGIHLRQDIFDIETLIKELRNYLQVQITAK